MHISETFSRREGRRDEGREVRGVCVWGGELEEV